jgi:pilus assembly protein CpaE
MHAGAKDCISSDVSTSELNSLLDHIALDNKRTELSGHKLTSIINAKGGSGASLIAGNIAHICSKASNEHALLLDMDLQFGTQSLLLDIKPAHTIIEALHDIDNIDIDSLNAYIAKHISGLHLLTTLHEQIVLPGEISIDSMKKLLDLSYVNHNQIFIDLPRLIDPLNAMIMESSNQIIIVVQQSLAHMRDAKRLIKIMKTELNIQIKNIYIVVNRFNPNNSFTLKDIKNTLECENILKISNDYERVAAAVNLGVPLLDYAKNTTITQELIILTEALGISINKQYKYKNLIDKTLSYFKK